MLAVLQTAKFAENKFCKMSAGRLAKFVTHFAGSVLVQLSGILFSYIWQLSCLIVVFLFSVESNETELDISSVSYTYAQRRKVDMQSVSFPSPSPPHLLIRIFSPRPRSSSVRRYFLEAVAPENTRFAPRGPLSRGRFPGI